MASHAIALHQLAGTYDDQALDALTRQHGGRVAAVRHNFMPLAPARGIGQRPAQWQAVGLYAGDGGAALGNAIAFFATDSAYVPQLRAALLNWRASGVRPGRVVRMGEPGTESLR